ncbi:hypothetical protein HFO69_26995 [Rhizobium laguerreae]|uniref:hypothetical protein n=1 Tax=Rhizobium laguerreae TaxID=1076926 RepID=UPI001C90D5C1|nr:hypothetical protein [Rhizobium laguerreae]MBY3101311.1 hypothetical protein [Rhizobium laguerreae]
MVQAIFENNTTKIDSLKTSLSPYRWATYLAHGEGDPIMAIRLYHWNTQLSQSLQVYLHGWEVCLRNRLSAFLAWKYSTSEWAFNTKLLRSLPGKDEAKIREAIKRQTDLRGKGYVTTAAVVADLSAGIWVSLLSKACEIPLAMRGTPGGNLYRIFPNARNSSRDEYWSKCDRILSVRNRVAHYEPVLHLALPEIFDEMQTVLGAMCATTQEFFEVASDFPSVFGNRPKLIPAAVENAAAQCAAL